MLLLISGIFTGCGWITEDMPECAPAPNTYTTVEFVYDYNMTGENLFNKNVGSVYLYVFDSKGIYRYRREAHRALMPPGDINFSMLFDDLQLQPGQTYQLVAVAQGNYTGYQASLGTPGFTLQTEMVPGISTINDYILKLDRDNDGTFDFGVVNYKDAYGHTDTMIDTLWTTKPNEVQIAPIPDLVYTPSVNKEPDRELQFSVPMMRITNSIKLNLINDLFDENTNVDDYLLLIDFPNGNGTIDFTGNTLPAQELYYRSLRKMMKPYTPHRPGDSKNKPAFSTKADENSTYALEATFGVSRLQVTDGSSLQVRDAQTNEIIYKLDDFSQWLADYFEHGFDDDQEFLDREYDFEIDIKLDDDGSLIYLQAGINILGWGKRIQVVDF